MNIDWKDTLKALMDNGDVPEDNSAEKPIAEETETGIKNVQKSALRVTIDRKGRKGKTATIIEGFEGSDEKLQQLAKKLKQRLGTGGSARNGEILIQGERKTDVIEMLKSLGYKAK